MRIIIFIGFQKAVLSELVQIRENQNIIIQRLNNLEGNNDTAKKPKEKIINNAFQTMEEFKDFDNSIDSDEEKFKQLVSTFSTFSILI